MPPQGEEQTGGCQGRAGKEGNTLRTACGGPAALPPAVLQTTPPCTCTCCQERGPEGRDSSPSRWGGLMKAQVLFTAQRKPLPFPLPRTSGYQAMRGREGLRGAHRCRCQGWLTSQCLCWGCPGAWGGNPGLGSARRVLGKASLQSHQGVACE